MLLRIVFRGKCEFHGRNVVYIACSYLLQVLLFNLFRHISASRHLMCQAKLVCYGTYISQNYPFSCNLWPNSPADTVNPCFAV